MRLKVGVWLRMQVRVWTRGQVRVRMRVWVFVCEMRVRVLVQWCVVAWVVV